MGHKLSPLDNLPLSRYLTLSSDSSLRFYPGNSKNDFRNKFEENFDSYSPLEVALLNLYYKPKGKKQKPTIFGHEPHDNEIRVAVKLLSIHYITNDQNRILGFLNLLNEEMKKRNLKITFYSDTTQDKKSYFLIDNQIEGFNVSLGSPYNRAMGFTKAFYENGSSKSEEEYSDALFLQIDKNIPFEMKIFKDSTYVKYVQEPQIQDAVHLISEMNTAIEDFDSTLIYDGKVLYYDCEYTKGLLYVTLSDFLCRVFGIEKNYVFSGVKKILPANKEIDFGISSEFILILADIVQPTWFKGNLLPLLGMVQWKESPTVVATPIQVPIYQPVMNFFDKSIHIQLIDENFRPIEFEENHHTFVTLHVKSMFKDTFS